MAMFDRISEPRGRASARWTGAREIVLEMLWLRPGLESKPRTPVLPERLRHDVGLPLREVRRDWWDY